MTRFLANWEVETDANLPNDIPFLRLDHPNGAYTAFLRNVVGDRNGLTYLSMQLAFDAPALSEAKEVGTRLAKQFLDYLSLASNLKLRLRRLFQIFNWEPGAQMREAIYFSDLHDPSNAPFPAISSELLSTITLLQKQDITPRLRRAMKWFASGVAAQTPDDQFALFWFVAEIVAQIVKNPSPVPDKCPVCKGPLYCDACEISPLHRPYPKQAIEQLFKRYGPKDEGLFFRRASEARNMLLHGEEITAIETALKMDFSDLVDDMGKLAWTAIINQFVPSLIGTKPNFIVTTRYVHFNMSGAAHVQIGYTPDFDNPDPSGFPKMELTIVTNNRPSSQSGEIETSHN